MSSTANIAFKNQLDLLNPGCKSVDSYLYFSEFLLGITAKFCLISNIRIGKLVKFRYFAD